jgi:hypothetical protein
MNAPPFDESSFDAQFSRFLAEAAVEASFIQTLGMSRPARIEELFQRPLLQSTTAETRVHLEDLIAMNASAIIVGGPGSGKTTLLNECFHRLVGAADVLPVLISLRKLNAVQVLEEFVGWRSARPLGVRVLLFVDGYDEIVLSDRRKVSQLLGEFEMLKCGAYYLTCQSHYAVHDLSTPRWAIAPFTAEQAEAYVAAYARAMKISVQPASVIAQLNARGLLSIASHPLMLNLVCVLLSGPYSDIPVNMIGLLRRAIDVLTFRWDQARAIERRSELPLDGAQRVSCLTRVAFGLPKGEADWVRVEALIREHLRLEQVDGINPRLVADELAQWYGILVPAGDRKWIFVHRTMCDYLGARYWVESGQFSPDSVREWDRRSAYAACLLPDATSSLICMLRVPSGMLAFRECVENKASFLADAVGEAIVDRYETFQNYQLLADPNEVRVETDEDVFNLSSTSALESFARTGAKRLQREGLVLTLYAVSELNHRHVPIDRQVLAALKPIVRDSRVKVVRGNGTFTFTLNELHEVA